MKLKKILSETMFNRGKFCRTDFPLRMIGVSMYAKTKEISNLWWRMQYGKLWYNFGKEGCSQEAFSKKIEIQKSRLTGIADLFIAGNYEVLPPIVIGKNGALIDGSHRLSCYIYFNVQEVPIKVSHEDGYRPEGEDVLIREWYTDAEWRWILNYRKMIIDVSRGETWIQ